MARWEERQPKSAIPPPSLLYFFPHPITHHFPALPRCSCVLRGTVRAEHVRVAECMDCLPPPQQHEELEGPEEQQEVADGTELLRAYSVLYAVPECVVLAYRLRSAWSLAWLALPLAHLWLRKSVSARQTLGVFHQEAWDGRNSETCRPQVARAAARGGGRPGARARPGREQLPGGGAEPVLPPGAQPQSRVTGQVLHVFELCTSEAPAV